MQNPPSNPSGASWPRALLILIVLGVVVADLIYFTRAMERRTPTLKRWLPYAAEIGQDDHLYEHHPDYLYPPFFLVLLRPLTHLPVTAAAILWQFGKFVSIGLIFAAIWNLAPRVGPFPPWAKTLTILVCLRFIVSDLRHGNVNLFIALCVVAGLWLMVIRRPFLAGACVALATCIKLTPALYAVYLLYKRRWAALAGFTLATVVFLEIAPLVLLTPRTNHALLVRWYDHVVGAFVSKGDVDSAGMNQSLVGVTNRLLGNSETVPVEDRLGWVHLLPRSIHVIQRTLALALVALLAWSCRGPTRRDDVPTICLEWSLVAPVCLALSGYTWTGHFCILIPAVAFLIATIAPDPLHRDRRGQLVLTTAAFAIFFLSSDLLTPAVREWTSRVGLQLLGALLLLAALVLARRRLRSPSLSQGEGGGEGSITSG